MGVPLERRREARKNMGSVARRVSIWAVAVSAALAVGAGSAHAATTCVKLTPSFPEICFDPDTGTGFVPASSGWWTSGYVDLTRAEELKLAKTIRFWYGFYHEEEYAVTCPWGSGTVYVMYRTQYDLSKRVVVRNGAVAGWKLLGREGDARTSVSNMLESGWGYESCTVDRLTATYDFVLLYISDPSGGPAKYIWRQGEGVCFLASSGDPYAC
jgi:hypothetical protein